MHSFDYYLKRPFEVFYTSIPVSEFELIGVPGEPGTFQSLALKRDYGTFFSQRFSCETNSGPELLCCLLGQHDEVKPHWLEYAPLPGDPVEEEWRLVTFYSGSIKDGTIKFQSVGKSKQKAFANLPSLDLDTLLLYELSVGTSEVDPEYYVLDAKDSRLKVSPNGEVLSESGSLIGASLFDPDELWDVLPPDVTLESLDIWEAKNQWIQSVIRPYFPDDAQVELASDFE